MQPSGTMPLAFMFRNPTESRITIHFRRAVTPSVIVRNTMNEKSSRGTLWATDSITFTEDSR